MSKQTTATRVLVYNGVLSAVAIVAILILEFPITPDGSLKIDPSDIPAAVAGVLMGPFAAVTVEFIKVMIHLVIKGIGSTMGYGDLMNFIVGVAFTVPFTVVYRRLQKRNVRQYLTVILSGLVGMAAMVAAGIVGNYFIAPPFFQFYMHYTLTQPILWAYIGSATILNVTKSVLITALLVPIAAVIKRRNIMI